MVVFAVWDEEMPRCNIIPFIRTFLNTSGKHFSTYRLAVIVVWSSNCNALKTRASEEYCIRYVFHYFLFFGSDWRFFVFVNPHTGFLSSGGRHWSKFRVLHAICLLALLFGIMLTCELQNDFFKRRCWCKIILTAEDMSLFFCNCLSNSIDFLHGSYVFFDYCGRRPVPFLSWNVSWHS